MYTAYTYGVCIQVLQYMKDLNLYVSRERGLGRENRDGSGRAVAGTANQPTPEGAPPTSHHTSQAATSEYQGQNMAPCT